MNKKRNPIAKAVTRIPNQRIESKKNYTRKQKHKAKNYESARPV